MKSIKLLCFFIVLFAFTSSCEYNEKGMIIPSHKVMTGRTFMVVYHKGKVDNSDYKNWAGENIYYVTDASQKGWLFTSYEEYNVGDTIYFCTKKCK